MLKAKRDAIIAILPEHVYIDTKVENPNQIDAYWTTKTGRFSLVTGEWDNTWVGHTRVIITALHNGENVTLRTEDPGRITTALVLLGAL